MIECVNGGPMDGDHVDAPAAARLFIRVSVPAHVPSPPHDRPAPVELFHVYTLRRQLQGDVYEYSGEQWR